MMRLFLDGGTGTLGNEIVRQMHEHCERLVVFSRDECKQAEMRKRYPEGGDRGLRYMIGDIRSINRVCQAMRGCDMVIHAAALKHVDTCEYNPWETVETNIIGTYNVIQACHIEGIKKCIVVSTDKAVNPINHYGASKLCAEKLAIASNNLGNARISIVRYGNVLASRGSVLDIWKRQISDGKPVSVTDENMTRFWISIENAAKFILSCFDTMQGGEIFVPKMKSCSMRDFVREYYPEAEIENIGIRPGEKMHETLIGEGDARDCYSNPDRYIAYPIWHDWTKGFKKPGKHMVSSFRYTSNGK